MRTCDHVIEAVSWPGLLYLVLAGFESHRVSIGSGVSTMATASSSANVPPKPHQPLIFSFPKRAFGKSKVVNRSFQPSWFGLWPFLHYDEANDSVFCHTCLMAFKLERITSSCADPAFVSYSYSNLIIRKVFGYFKYNLMIRVI